MSSSIQILKTCLFCRNGFIAHTLYTRYCSHVCNRRHYKQIKREEKLNKNIKRNDSTLKHLGIDLANLQQKLFLSINETALLLGASRRTIQRLIAKGSIKVAKIGARSIIQRSEIDKLFK